MKVLVYAVVNQEKVFLGIFESTETIYEDVEAKLSELGFSEWTSTTPIYMLGSQHQTYRLLWEDKK